MPRYAGRFDFWEIFDKISLKAFTASYSIRP